MKQYLIDTHSHIDMIEKPIDEILSEMADNNVKKVIIPAVEEKTLDKILKIAEQHSNIYAMIGLYPSEIKSLTEDLETKFQNLAKNKKVVAVGEIGLDYYWDKSFVEEQKQGFIKQIKLANKLELPIVVHDREAHKDCFDILKEHNKNSKVLFHCFSGSVEFMKECVKQGWYIAIGGVVTFKNAVKLKEVVKEVPLDKLMLETDAPYLTPVPYRGKENQPSYVKYVAEEIANLRGMTFAEIANITTQNAEEFFNI